MGVLAVKYRLFHCKTGQRGVNIKQAVAAVPVNMHGNDAVHIVKHALSNHVLLTGKIADFSFFFQTFPALKVDKFLCRSGNKADPAPGGLHNPSVL